MFKKYEAIVTVDAKMMDWEINTQSKRFFFLFQARSWAQNLCPKTAISYCIVKNKKAIEEKFLVIEARSIGSGLWYFSHYWGTKEDREEAMKENAKKLGKKGV